MAKYVVLVEELLETDEGVVPGDFTPTWKESVKTLAELEQTPGEDLDARLVEDELRDLVNYIHVFWTGKWRRVKFSQSDRVVYLDELPVALAG